MKHSKRISLSVLITVTCLLIGVHTFYADETDWDQAKEAIAEGLAAIETEISLSEYHIPNTQMQSIYEDVMNDNANLFYVSGGFQYAYDPSSNEVLSILPVYIGTEDEIAQQKLLFQEASDEALSEIHSKDEAGKALSDVEILIQIHDYLVKTATYDEEAASDLENDPTASSAYGILVEKTGVCSGYAAAFAYLAEYCFGIETVTVSSDPMNHAWNLVEVDGEYYHVDVTWDDPIWADDSIRPYYVNHNHFLCSDTQIKARNHYSWDDVGITCNSTKYDDAFGKSGNVCENVYIEGEWYYFARYDGIYKYSEEGNYQPELVVALPGIHAMAVKDKNFYYLSWDYEKVYVYNLGTGAISEQDVEGINLANGLGYEDGNIYYSLDDGSKVKLDITVAPVEPGKVGWQNTDGEWYYYSAEGVKQFGWQRINSKWYYFDGRGIMQTGWLADGGSWYYLNADGDMHIGWKKVDGNWYYLNDDGKMHVGWKKLNNKWYYFNLGGMMRTDWQEIAGSWYYFNADGDMHIGWKKYGNHWYYLNEDGKMHTSWKKLNSKWYYFNAGGMMRTDWQEIGGKWYFFNSDGDMHTGWKKYNNKWYYLNEDGVMVTGRYMINGTWNSFTSDGVWIG